MGPHTSPSDQDRSTDSTVDSGSNSAHETDPTDHCRTDGGVSDRTASSVFADLAADDEPVDTDAILGDTSPTDLIDGSVTPDPAIQAPADLFDEAAFDDLLLPDRREGDEFLWIETPDSTSTTEPSWGQSPDEGTDRSAGSDADDVARTATGSDEPDSVPDQPGSAFDDSDTGYEEIDLGSIFAGAAEVGDGGGGRVPPRTDSPTEKLDDSSSNEPTPDEPSAEASRLDSEASQVESDDSSSNPTGTEGSSNESSSRIQSILASLRSLVPGL
ncbi:hypothetical protein Halru_1434 [Halovivax ruber XH-70]|uniref:Uncharacterized protein n=1 Tax=Halovivax ruber (strain DSM 18193 / JCM 13892 / XH-70) TaxID=797302 RepID=L0I8W7_HALRX|nr:hypothetical protein [Halovivax ruber]AGB16045.1 hypothetical protein Halru_1434 [Halovivax ruber XH-70]